MSTAIRCATKMSISRSLLPLLLILPLLLYPCNGREAKIESAPLFKDPQPLRRRLHGKGVHREFYCSIQYTPITQVAMNETVGKVYEVNETDTTTTTYAAKLCDCYSGLLNSTISYCPADSVYCSVSVAYDYQHSYYASLKEGHDPIVTCFRDTQLKAFARYVWKYSTIILAALTVVLIFTDTGHVSVENSEFVLRYILLIEILLTPTFIISPFTMQNIECYETRAFTLHTTNEHKTSRTKTSSRDRISTPAVPSVA